MYTTYNKLRKSFCDIIPHGKKPLCKAVQTNIIIYNV